MRIDIWTDGSCQPNPGPGGWAAILEAHGHRKEIGGYIEKGTNLRAEMIAVIEAFRSVRGGPHNVTLHTDSEYVRRAIEGMKNPKANFDLLEELEKVIGDRLNVTVNWIRGHSGNPNNELCDTLAMKARLKH